MAVAGDLEVRSAAVEGGISVWIEGELIQPSSCNKGEEREGSWRL